jgi:hypothetical protein
MMTLMTTKSAKFSEEVSQFPSSPLPRVCGVGVHRRCDMNPETPDAFVKVIRSHVRFGQRRVIGGNEEMESLM